MPPEVDARGRRTVRTPLCTPLHPSSYSSWCPPITSYGYSIRAIPPPHPHSSIHPTKIGHLDKGPRNTKSQTEASLSVWRGQLLTCVPWAPSVCPMILGNVPSKRAHRPWDERTHESWSTQKVFLTKIFLHIFHTQFITHSSKYR